MANIMARRLSHWKIPKSQDGQNNHRMVTSHTRRHPGSVIGPILFILYIYDINKYIPDEAQLKKYADDILAYLIGNYDRTLPQRIADGVDKWFSDNQMRLNTNKCKIISVLPKNTQAAPTVNLHGQILE